MNITPKNFILDVDGVMTDGKFYYNRIGKEFKVFGPDDHDALKILNEKINIQFVTGDNKGFDISKKRIVDDMGFRLDLVNTFKRIEWIKEKFDPNYCIYMGDGIFDSLVMKQVFYSISPNNADQKTKDNADYVTIRDGGDRAVAEACIHIMDVFFDGFEISKLIDKSIIFSGV